MTTASERREKERRERPSEAETKRYLEIIEEKVEPKCEDCIHDATYPNPCSECVNKSLFEDAKSRLYGRSGVSDALDNPVIGEKVKPKPCPECGGVMSYNISKYAPYVRVRMCGDCAYEVLGASE